MLQGEARVPGDSLPQGVGSRELLEQEMPLRQRHEALRRDADRNRDSLHRLEVHAHGVQGEVRLDDLARPAARHRKDAADLERQPFLGLLGPCEPVRGIFRLAELETAEKGRERRMGRPGGGQGLFEEPVKAVGRRRRRPRAHRFLQDRPAKARRDRVDRFLLQLGFGHSGDGLDARLLAGPREAAHGREQRLGLRDGVGKGVEEGGFDEIESFFGEQALERGAVRQPSIPFFRSSDGGFGPSQSRKTTSAKSLPSNVPRAFSPARKVVPFPGT